jgi:hypothetical protein
MASPSVANLERLLRAAGVIDVRVFGLVAGGGDAGVGDII